jgi:uncharacterized protein YjlB
VGPPKCEFGHCLQFAHGPFSVIGAYPPGQQWDIRREALTAEEFDAMQARPFPASDPVFGAQGPVIEHWLPAR